MKVGISTASLFFRMTSEEALKFLSENNIQTSEVFLESFCEYKKEFGNLLKSVKGNIDVHSVHTLTTQFEPQLYSINARARADSFELLKQTMEVANIIGAKYYTFHGGARFKKTPFTVNYDTVAKTTQEIIDTIKPYGVTLAYENVHWGYYNYVGFFDEIRKRTNGLKGTFDIKQARQSNIFYGDFITEMGKDIVTAHLSDIDQNGKLCLPGKGITDFEEVIKRLVDVGFDGAILIEVYQSDYKETEELFESVNYLKNVVEKIK